MHDEHPQADQFASHGRGDSGYQHRAHAHGSRAIGIGVALTGGFAVVEAVGGWLSGSLALLADAGHMATDASALLFALAANVVARKPASDRHSFGLARAEIVAAFVNALAMLAVVAWLSIEALQRIGEPRAVRGEAVLGIAVVGLLVNLMVARVLSRDQRNVNTRAALIHVMGDLLGSIAAIVAGGVIALGGPVIVDPLLSLLVGALILRSTFGVLRETTLVLLDSVPADVDFRAVGRALAEVPGVLAVHDLHVWLMVPGRVALSAHVQIERIEEWPAILHYARSVLRSRFRIDHVTLQPEWLRAEPPPSAIRIRPQP